MGSGFIFLPIILGIIWLTIVFGLLYLVYTWVQKFIALKQEHNDLLREIIKKMDRK